MPIQYKFNSYTPLLTGYNYGENIGLEIYDNTLNKEIMIESATLYFTPRSKIVNALTG